MFVALFRSASILSCTGIAYLSITATKPKNCSYKKTADNGGDAILLAW